MNTDNISGYPSASSAWYTTIVLSVVYLFSFLDRQILILLVEPLKADLNISDTQVSLLTGAAFAVLYAIMGLPFGWAADRYPRKWVIGIGITIWSVMTMLCGLARTFPMLFAARMGVGVGEASLTPTVHGMMPDLHPPNQLARGMAAFSVAAAIGSGFALLLGGAVLAFVENVGSISVPLLGDLRGWQLVLIVVGALTLLTLVPLTFITDPPRRNAKSGERATEERSLKFAFSYIGRHWRAYAPLMIGVTMMNMFVYGASAWAPTLLIRQYDTNASSVGFILGTLLLVGGPISIFGSAWISDRLRQSGFHDAPLRIFIFCFPVAVLGFGLAAFSGSYTLSVFGVLIGLMSGFIIGPLAPTALQYITTGGVRSQVSAIWLMTANLAGIGLGPMIPALITDYVLQDPEQVGTSLFIFTACAVVIAVATIARFRKDFAKLSQELHQ